MIEKELVGFALMLLVSVMSICFGLYWFTKAQKYRLLLLDMEKKKTK